MKFTEMTMKVLKLLHQVTSISSHKNKTFKTTDRVQWFEYSSDGIVVNGGYGTLLEIKKQDLPNYSVVFFSVLCDDGTIRDIVSNDIEPMDEWE